MCVHVWLRLYWGSGRAGARTMLGEQGLYTRPILIFRAMLGSSDLSSIGEGSSWAPQSRGNSKRKESLVVISARGIMSVGGRLCWREVGCCRALKNLRGTGIWGSKKGLRRPEVRMRGKKRRRKEQQGWFWSAGMSSFSSGPQWSSIGPIQSLTPLSWLNGALLVAPHGS